jgi:hypothetical protein
MYFLSFQYVKELDPGKPGSCDEVRIRTDRLPDLYQVALPLS